MLCASSVQPVYLACQHGGLLSEVRQVRTMHDRLSCMYGDSKTSMMLDLAQREKKWIHITNLCIHSQSGNVLVITTSMLLCTALSHSRHNVLHSPSRSTTIDWEIFTLRIIRIKSFMVLNLCGSFNPQNFVGS